MKLGDIFAGRYKILHPIGKGGLWEVYLVEDIVINRMYALKVLDPFLFDSDEIRKMLINIRDSRIFLCLLHSNIVNLFDVDIDISSNRFYIVMEYIEGENLNERLEHYKMNYGRNFSVEEVLEVARDVCPAIDYAHKKGVLHLNIKPSKIIAIKSGGYKIREFGFINIELNLHRMMSRNTIIGTPIYMSPEQILGKMIDERADVYGLSTTFYFLLAGHPPFYSENYGELFKKKLEQKPEKIVGIPYNINSAILWGLERDPDDRPKSAMELFNAMIK